MPSCGLACEFVLIPVIFTTTTTHIHYHRSHSLCRYPGHRLTNRPTANGRSIVMRIPKSLQRTSKKASRDSNDDDDDAMPDDDDPLSMAGIDSNWIVRYLCCLE